VESKEKGMPMACIIWTSAAVRSASRSTPLGLSCRKQRERGNKGKAYPAENKGREKTKERLVLQKTKGKEETAQPGTMPGMTTLLCIRNEVWVGQNCFYTPYMTVSW
jgi:hypothetical protein